MTGLETFLIALGGTGFLGATFACPAIASLIQRSKRAGRGATARLGESRGLHELVSGRAGAMVEIVIPAHNEEAVIGRTLLSIVESIKRLPSEKGAGPAFKITVILDHCSDRTLEIVESFALSSGVRIEARSNPGQAGKWFVLDGAIRSSSADWIAFVDSGSIWNPDLASEIAARVGQKDLLAIAPSYMATAASSDRVSWKLEQLLKRTENRAGGPVTVHGATVVYRLTPLKAIWPSLRITHWLNDDVVIPLSLRLANPSMRIEYVARAGGAGWVEDIGVRDGARAELRRRNRMVFGNLQWVQGVLLPQFSWSSPAVWVGLRRVFRLFWAYWTACIGIGLFLLAFRQTHYFVSVIWLTVFVSAIGSAVVILCASSGCRRLAAAFVAGLQVPGLWFRLSFQQNKNGKDISWN